MTEDLPQAIIPPLPLPDLLSDLNGLPESACLLRHKGYEVWLAPAAAIPALLREIGRLRETAFRAVGEGTGQAVDLDRYDAHYRHLFIWHAGRQAVIGAYRLGFSDDFYPRLGLDGFYTWQLFEYEDAFIRQLAPCIELGRSFVRVEDQRSFVPLLLLWRAIATIAYQQPQYRRLFGPVSISADIPPLFRQLLAESLLKFHSRPELSVQIRPRRPLPGATFSPDLMAGLADCNNLESLLAQFAPGLRMPVLIRQYLTLNGRLLSFSVDPDFNNSLDGLVLVDLDRVDEQTLGRYMGAEEARTFLQMTGTRHEDACVGDSRAA